MNPDTLAELLRQTIEQHNKTREELEQLASQLVSLSELKAVVQDRANRLAKLIQAAQNLLASEVPNE